MQDHVHPSEDGMDRAAQEAMRVGYQAELDQGGTWRGRIFES
jgi:hypothetical protein